MMSKRIDRLGMRVDPQDKKKWRDAATREGISLSKWIEKRLNEAANKR